MKDPLLTTMFASYIRDGDAERLELGVAGGVQSCSASSKTQGKSSSSEIMKELQYPPASRLEVEERDAL
jgi:hypothetical protein